jgi:signal peptidase I
MARQKARKPFPTETKRKDIDTNRGYISNERNGISGFLSDRGIRETIESVVVAIILALLFRTFEAEAFVIPTGSMAPALQGQHRDINCEQCNYLYQTSASEESSTSTSPLEVTHTYCPICRFRTTMSAQEWDHTSNNGDRILVNKFVFDFSEPKRFDVIVFKNPNNGKQNYIKRLIGLPGEVLIVENGDIFRLVETEGGVVSREIIRKPSHKLSAMLQVVDDTNFIPEKLHDAGWPLRWSQWNTSGNESSWEATVNSNKPNYIVKSNEGTQWLSYRHLVPISRPDFTKATSNSVPEFDEWDFIKVGELPERMKANSPVGSLINDYYCYNDRVLQQRGRSPEHVHSFGMHWVGDLAFESWIEVKSSSGTLKFQLVEGGTKFICTIDVETGKATLSSDQDSVTFQNEEGQSNESPTGNSAIKGSGKYRVLFANVDDQLRLSVNNKFVEFDAPFFERTDKPLPRFFPGDDSNLGDAEPAAIGAENLEMEVTRLKLYRDAYYTSPTNMDQSFLGNETAIGKFLDQNNRIGTRGAAKNRVWQWMEDPTKWETAQVKKYFSDRFRSDPYVFRLEEDQFLPMGDNSPSSLDGRVWDGPKNVERDMLIGRALFIYWPHALNSPVPYFPNFQKMKFIR